MSKAKRNKPFLEVLRGSQSTYGPGRSTMPDWWKSRDIGVAGPRPIPAPRPQVEPEPVEEPAPAAPPRIGTVAVNGDRLMISLSSLTAGVSVCLLVVLIGLVYLFGVRVGREKGEELGYQAGIDYVQQETTDEIQAARNARPDTGIFKGLRSSPVKGASSDRPRTAGSSDGSAKLITPSLRGTPASTPVWVKDHTYIVVQEFRAGDLADAEDAHRFLAKRGVDAVILESGGTYKYRLVATKGFDRGDPNQRKWCDRHQERIRKLGEEYVKAGGRYGLQGYQKRLTGETW